MILTIGHKIAIKTIHGSLSINFTLEKNIISANDSKNILQILVKKAKNSCVVVSKSTIFVRSGKR